MPAEQIAGQARYRRAIGDDGLIGSMIVTVTHGEPGSTLAAFDVLTDSWAVGPRLTYPLIRSRAETLLLDGGFTVQERVESRARHGLSHDKWRVLDIGGALSATVCWGGDWTSTFDVAQGLPIFGATDNHSAGAVARRRPDRFHQAHRLLPPAEPLSVIRRRLGAGPDLVRAADHRRADRIWRHADRPWLRSGRDHRRPWPRRLGGASLRRAHRDSVFRALEPYIFFERAWAWYLNGAAIAAAAEYGLGRRRPALLSPLELYLDVEAARTLNAVPGSDNDKQATKVLMDASVRF